MHVQGDTLLLADVFENFRNMHFQVYDIDPARFLTATGLAWQAALKKTEIISDLLTEISLLLMVETVIRGGICHAIYRYPKANSKCMKDYDKDKESPCLQYLDVNNLYGWAMLQKLSVNDFEWIEDTSQFNEDFMKNYNEEIDERYFLEVDVQYSENLHNLHKNLPFLLREWKLKRSTRLQLIYMIKVNIPYT